MQIGKAEIVWNFFALISKIGANFLLLPYILSSFSKEYVAIWNVFSLVTPIIVLFDFGFSSIFTQNLIYVFSGSQKLLKTGIDVNKSSSTVNYSLLIDLITAMKWIYSRISFLLFILLLVGGFFYIKILIGGSILNKNDIYAAWIILIFANSLFFYTFYFEPLLISCGKIKVVKQIVVLGQVLYIFLAYVFLLFFKSFICISLAQLISILIVRYLSYKSFYTYEMKQRLSSFNSNNHKDVIKLVSFNARKLGLTALGGFLVQRSPFIFAGIYLTISEVASYGITMQIIFLTMSISTVYISTKIPLVLKYRVLDEKNEIMKIYLKNITIIIVVYSFSYISVLLFGNYFLDRIRSSTFLLDRGLLTLGFFVSMIEALLSSSAMILQTKNEVPFYIPSLLSGFVIIIGLFISFYFYKFGIYTLFIVPLFVDLLYQAWKWPMEVYFDLKEKN